MPTVRQLAGVIAAIMAAISGAGCSTIVDLAGVARPGIQPDGSYVLTQSELGLDCPGLAEHVEATLTVMKQHSARVDVERREMPRTVSGLLGRAFDSRDGGLASAKQARHEEARAQGLAAEQVRKGCTVDDPIGFQARIAEARGA